MEPEHRASWPELVGALLRSADEIGELVAASRIARSLAEHTGGPLLERALDYIRRRAVLLPEALANVEAAVGPGPGPGPGPAPAPAPAPASASASASASAAVIDRGGLEPAVAWIDARLGSFAATDDPASLKAIAELAHAGEILERRDWIEHGWSELGAGVILAERVAASSRNALMATLLPPFARAGLDCADALEAIAARLPTALLGDVEWAYLCPVLESLELEPPASGRAAAARASILGNRRDPWTLDLAATYQLTHEVFYATDWGARPLADVDYVARWLPCWIEHHRERGDIDLVAELLMVARISGVAVPAEAWAQLATAQGDDGSIAPPADRSIDDRHPTLVAIMAWAL